MQLVFRDSHSEKKKNEGSETKFVHERKCKIKKKGKKRKTRDYMCWKKNLRVTGNSIEFKSLTEIIRS